MKIKAIALASLLGIATPIITDSILFPQAAIAEIVYPEGLFRDEDWNVRLEYQNGIFIYSSENVKTGDSLRLNISEASGSPQRNTYTFRNGDYEYLVAYRPQDPNLIRLQVIDPNGSIILNRLLTKATTDISQTYPEGYYKDNQWGVRLEYKNGEFTYFGERFGTSDYLELHGSQISGNSQRYTYTFNNNNYQYIVAYRPNQPELIRLQVISPDGLTILNRLLTRVGNDFDV